MQLISCCKKNPLLDVKVCHLWALNFTQSCQVTGVQIHTLSMSLSLSFASYTTLLASCSCFTIPTNNALLINFLLSSDAEVLFNKLRPSIRVGTQTCKKNVCAARACSDRASILHMPPLVVGDGKKRAPGIHLQLCLPSLVVCPGAAGSSMVGSRRSTGFVCRGQD